MPQAYSNPKRESDEHALPNIEYFYVNEKDMLDSAADALQRDFGDPAFPEIGWYFWYCQPGCLPDGEPYGPYATERECIEAFRDGVEDGFETDDSDESE